MDPTQILHQRHKTPRPLERPRELIVACPPMRSNVNLSRIVRAAGCGGVRKMICCGTAKIVQRIARDAAAEVDVQIHRTLPPVLRRLKAEGYRVVVLEQASGSTCLYDLRFARKTVLVAGNERQGVSEEVLQLADEVAEIPVHGPPHSHNVATAVSMALYEYCRQFPAG